MAVPTLLEVPDAERDEHEIALRRSGYVPLTAHDAPLPSFCELLPDCHVQQVVPDRQHGRVVWSHPGRSGLDPRAIAPLAIVRVADGLGPDALDPPTDLAGAARELLDQDVEEWVRRSRHRILVRTGDTTCLYDTKTGCLTHPAADPLLQQVADALGDPSYAECRPRTWSGPHCTRWGPPAPHEKAHDLTGLARCALDATLRLGDWLRLGESGRTAWELAALGMTEQTLGVWHDAGFGTEEATLWRRLMSARSAVRALGNGMSPYRPIELPPAPVADSARGLGGFARWKISVHQPQRYRGLVRCQLCGAGDDHTPCRTCRAEGRTVALTVEWSEHEALATLDPAYATGDPPSSVACGQRDCRTSLALSAAAEGAGQ